MCITSNLTSMGLLNYSTKIDADKTASEITKCLSMHGASSITTDYEDGVLSAISFAITMNNRKMGFRLPCRLAAGLRDTHTWKEKAIIVSDRQPQP